MDISHASTLNASPLRLETTQPDFEAAFARRLHWSAEQDDAIEQRVKDILADVRERAVRAAHWLSHAEWTDGWSGHE